MQILVCGWVAEQASRCWESDVCHYKAWRENTNSLLKHICGSKIFLWRKYQNYLEFITQEKHSCDGRMEEYILPETTQF